GRRVRIDRRDLRCSRRVKDAHVAAPIARDDASAVVREAGGEPEVLERGQIANMPAVSIPKPYQLIASGRRQLAGTSESDRSDAAAVRRPTLDLLAVKLPESHCVVLAR